MNTNAEITARITATKALIIVYEDALLALATAGIQQYTLDTGQSRQTVTKLDIEKLNKTYQGLLNLCTTLEARLNGGGSIMRPAW